MAEFWTPDELLDLIKCDCADHEDGQKGMAADIGISQAFLSDILHGRRSISAAVATKLGFARRVVFVDRDEATAGGDSGGFGNGPQGSAMSKHIPESQRQTCKACSRPDKFDFYVDEDIWSRVLPKELRNRVVCLYCFDAFAARKGVSYAASLRSLYFSGDGACFTFQIERRSA